MSNLLMIPGPIELSPRVLAALQAPPLGHLAPSLMNAFGRSLEMMREVWLAPASSQPFVVAGSGTLAMESAVCNLFDPGERAVVVQTGYFSDRMAEMLRRRGAEVALVEAAPGDAPSLEEVEASLRGGAKAVFVTHVDTSTGVLADVAGIAALARAHGALVVVDGVCATAAEACRMEAWGLDVVLTASQKAIGLPVGLALWVASEQALEARARLRVAPPMYLDWQQWLPIMRAYEARKPSYFATPATLLLPALEQSLAEMLDSKLGDLTGMEARFALHTRGASAMRAAWSAMGLSMLPARPALWAHALSAVRYPFAQDPTFPARVAARGVLVAGGLYPGLQASYFRVGHMGDVLHRPHDLLRTVAAIGGALVDGGHPADVAAAVQATQAALA